MQGTKSLKLLKSLDKEEFRRLGKFLRSPFYSYNKSLVALYEYLRKYHPGLDSKKLAKEKVWAKLFPEKGFNDNGYWNLCFQFQKMMEKFLVALQLEAQPEDGRKLYIRALGQHNVYDLFERETKTLVEKINGGAQQDIHSYSESLWLKHDYFFSPQTDKYGGAAYAVEDAMEDLDRFYFLAKLRFASEIKNRERIFSKKVPVQLLEECISASKKYEEENPAFLMYKIVLDLYVPEKAEAAFRRGKELIEAKFPLMSRHDQNEVMLNFRNYAIRGLNRGGAEFLSVIFYLQKLSIKLGLILVDGKLNETTYGNTIKIGCLVKDFEWTERFINEYSKYLSEDIKEDGRVMGKAVIFFGKEDFYKTIDVLENHEFKNLLYQLESRILLIKSWFEHCKNRKDLLELLMAKLEAAEKYFRRGVSVSEQKKVAHINFILATRKITESIRLPNSNNIKNKMEKYFKKNNDIVSKSWLVEKVETMSKYK